MKIIMSNLFGGADHETIYTLTLKDSNKLYDLLDKEYKEKGGKGNLYLQELICYKFERDQKKKVLPHIAANTGLNTICKVMFIDNFIKLF